MSQTIRINAIEVTIDSDLNVSYRLTLPIKGEHIHLFDFPAIQSSNKNKGNTRYYYVVNSNNKEEILQKMRAAQLLITDANLVALQNRKDVLLSQLAQPVA